MLDFATLYERYAPHVHRFAFYLSGDAALADDITSETFVRAWTSGAPIRQETVKAYLFTIARNLHTDAWHRSRRHAPLTDQVEDARSRTDRRAVDRSELAFVLARMRELPDMDRAALLMRARDGMSYEEIARVLDLPLATLKVRIHRARLKLLGAAKPARP